MMTNPLRPMRARDQDALHRPSTQLELIFDLVIVIAIASLIIVFAGRRLYFAEVQHLNSTDFWPILLWANGLIFIFALISLALAMLALWALRDSYMALGERQLALPVSAGLTLAATAMRAPPLGYAAIVVAVLLWRVDFTTNEGLHS